ncbi:MAG: hypothetical protein ABL931_20765 [Usitatibacteraceae bacterium]
MDADGHENLGELAFKEFDALHGELLGDLRFFVKTQGHSHSQHWRRSYCRAVSAYLEAITAWVAKDVLNTFAGWCLGENEAKLLERRLSAIERTFHALDLYADTAGACSALHRGSVEWCALERMIKIRNRLTHPKRAQDIIVSDDDLQAVEMALDVTRAVFVETFRQSAMAQLGMVRRFRKTMATAPLLLQI